jgi:hypothetical protein
MLCSYAIYYYIWLNIIYSLKLIVIFYKALRIDKCHDLDIQTVNMLLFNPLRQS